MRRLNLYDQSLIVITADHGTSFTNGFQGYSSPLILAAEHSIPLLVKFPGQSQGKRVTSLVSNVDIFPTVLDTIGVSYPATAIDGQSLLRAERDGDRLVFIRKMEEPITEKGTYAVLWRDLKLVSRKGSKSLYDIARDPSEEINLVGRLNLACLQGALDSFISRVESVNARSDASNVPLLPIDSVCGDVP